MLISRRGIGFLMVSKKKTQVVQRKHILRLFCFHQNHKICVFTEKCSNSIWYPSSRLYPHWLQNVDSQYCTFVWITVNVTKYFDNLSHFGRRFALNTFLLPSEYVINGTHPLFIALIQLLEFINRYHHPLTHDDVIKWRHFPCDWPFVLEFTGRIHRSPVNSPRKGQWRGALTFSLICVWINGWINNDEAGGLRRHRPHYNVIVIVTRQPLALEMSNVLVQNVSRVIKIHNFSVTNMHMKLSFAKGRPFCTGKMS